MGRRKKKMCLFIKLVLYVIRLNAPLFLSHVGIMEFVITVTKDLGKTKNALFANKTYKA